MNKFCQEKYDQQLARLKAKAAVETPLKEDVKAPDRVPAWIAGGSSQQDLGQPYQVVIWDDPVNTMDHVMTGLLKIIDEIKDLQTAAMLMLVAHHNGSCAVARVPKSKAELYRDALEKWGITATMEKA